jgi:Uma2 family endonuclease
MTVTFVDESREVAVPRSLNSLETFRRWFHSTKFPDNVRVHYLKGEVYVDMSGEQIFTHALVKTKIAGVLTMLVEAENSGLFIVDGALLSNVDADFACIPDALFVSNEAQQDRVRFLEGAEEGYVELEGTPDMVLEVVSRSSVNKDTVLLRTAYHEASIREYWLVDARRDPLQFDILHHTARGYTAARKRDGWMRSAVFNREFRLILGQDARQQPTYRLEMRDASTRKARR